METKIIPNHLQIEPINGVCTSRCIMCTFNTWTRKKNRMSYDVFIRILEKFLPYRNKIRFLTLHGEGEALLDKEFTQKVRIAKEMKFNGVGFATNCTELSEKKSIELLEAGLDTIICSIDGIKKETHESIRIGTNFEQCVNNVEKFVENRNKTGKTKIMIRFIRQELNKHEWPEFQTYWKKRLNPEYGDDVVKFDVHNWGDELKDYKSKDPNLNMGLKKTICEDLFERMYIHSNGDVALCTTDSNGFYKMGNVLQDDPIAIYNNFTFTKYRKMMEQGRIFELKYCRTCTIPRSRSLKDKE